MDKGIFAQAMFTYAKVVAGNKPDFSDQDVIEFWYDALKDVPLQKLGAAIKKLCKGLHFPTIETILKQCGQVEFDPDEIAREFIPQIVGLIEKHGHPNEARARKEVGEERWGIITALGGWQYICSLDYSDINFMLPQWRETAKVYLKKFNAGIENAPIAIERSKGLVLVDRN
jgi:hypothetical protein